MTQVDLTTLDGTQLLAVYNKISTTQRKAKFQSKDEAIARIKKLMAEKAKANSTEAEAPAKPAKAAKPSKTPAPSAAKPAKANGKDKPAPTPAKAAKPAKVGVKAQKEEAVIRIMTEGGENPRREGSDAYRYFEAMKGGVSVAEYMSKFPSDKDERKKAKQWLWNTKRDGHVELVGL